MSYMPRKPFHCDPLTPYHLVARTNNRRPFNAPMCRIWSIYEDQLFFLHHAFGVQIHCFVLMSNHFHLIATFPNVNFGESIRTFMGTTSRVVSFEENSKNHLYGGRAYRSRLGSFHYFVNAYKYIYLNPVRAGICRRVEDYEFSTLGGLLGKKQMSIPLAEDTLIFDDPIGCLKWLNTHPSNADISAVRKALRRLDFKFAKDASNRPHRLELERL